MSYTKFSKAVTKWLKANGLPCYGTAYDKVTRRSPYEQILKSQKSAVVLHH